MDESFLHRTTPSADTQDDSVTWESVFQAMIF